MNIMHCKPISSPSWSWREFSCLYNVLCMTTVTLASIPWPYIIYTWSRVLLPFHVVPTRLSEVQLGPTESSFSGGSTGSCCGAAFHPGNACSTKGIRPTVRGGPGRGCVPAVVGACLCLQAWWRLCYGETFVAVCHNVVKLKVSQNSIEVDTEN